MNEMSKSGNPLGYVDSDYLRAAAELLQPFKLRTYERMEIRAGSEVLDVGCGAGADAIPLANIVGVDGFVAGVDHDRQLLRRAEQAARSAGLRARTAHYCAEADRLPFPSARFEAVRSERLFQHLPRPEQVLAELVRVTRPGGRVVVLDTDHGTWSVDTPEKDIERRLTRFKADHFGYNGYAGRQLYRLFHEAGLQDVTCEMISGHFTDYRLARFMFLLDEVEPAAVEAGVITAEELRRWRSSLDEAASRGTFFCSESMVLAAGRKGG